MTKRLGLKPHLSTDFKSVASYRWVAISMRISNRLIRQRIFLALFIGLPFWASAQQNDSTFVKAVFGPANPELQELMSVIGIEKHHLELDDRRLKGKFIQLTYQEYRSGVAQPEVNLTSRKDLFQLDSTGKIAFDVYARAIDAVTLEAVFRFPRVGQRKQFKTKAGQAGQYSFRTDILLYQNQKAKIPIGKTFTFLVYTLPYEKDGYLQYCALAQSQVPIEEWYKRFGIKHFVAYQLLIE
ncbi:hypothetical protein DYBT9623_05459 [Dyadobacter sp. CECT 9623]|uniref:DUF3857 domain-containing protein n=1 Tax=Dyadobacter linearis TaxID=2823330 RepID=A0ABN7RF61_9BACT|nr:hypothetical protein [Dyadobacter sp. CECT 9623]CAG5074771.1 hypothetical protein DYBT9623_05459 [Dyadobacter sp. CECT 9623]